MKVSTRQTQKLNTRRRIIDISFKVFSEKGFSVPTSVIAKEAGISHGSVFAHFPTYDDLLICVITDFGNKIGERLHTLAEKNDSLKNMLNAHLDVLESFELFYIWLIKELSTLPNEAKNTYAAIQSAVSFHFSTAIDEEIKKRNVNDLPLHMLFNTWIGLIHYYLQNKEFFAPNSESILQKYREELLSSYLTLIYKESGTLK